MGRGSQPCHHVQSLRAWGMATASHSEEAAVEAMAAAGYASPRSLSTKNSQAQNTSTFLPSSSLLLPIHLHFLFPLHLPQTPRCRFSFFSSLIRKFLPEFGRETRRFSFVFRFLILLDSCVLRRSLRTPQQHDAHTNNNNNTRT